jgi:hypothetical protein
MCVTVHIEALTKPNCAIAVINEMSRQERKLGKFSMRAIIVSGWHRSGDEQVSHHHPIIARRT